MMSFPFEQAAPRSDLAISQMPRRKPRKLSMEQRFPDSGALVQLHRDVVCLSLYTAAYSIPLRSLENMLINKDTALSTRKVLLVPYRRHHVAQYHEWMQDAAVQEATASDPLPLSEEYAMQESWLTDGDKLTFIICQQLPISNEPALDIITTTLTPTTYDHPSTMLGDINLFLSATPVSTPTPSPSLQSPSSLPSTPLSTSLTGELNLMIPYPHNRRQGHARAALLTFIAYILAHRTAIADEYHRSFPSEVTTTSPESEHEIKARGKESNSDTHTQPLIRLTAKISATNIPSLALFRSVGFQNISSSSRNNNNNSSSGGHDAPSLPSSSSSSPSSTEQAEATVNIFGEIELYFALDEPQPKKAELKVRPEAVTVTATVTTTVTDTKPKTVAGRIAEMMQKFGVADHQSVTRDAAAAAAGEAGAGAGAGAGSVQCDYDSPPPPPPLRLQYYGVREMRYGSG